MKNKNTRNKKEERKKKKTRNKFTEDARKRRSNKRQNSEAGGKGKNPQVNIIHKE